MTDDDTTSDESDENTIADLEEKKERYERMGLPTDRLDEEREEKEKRAEWARERAQIEMRLQGTEGGSMPEHVREELDARREELDEALAAPIREEIEDLQGKADHIEQVADTAEQIWSEEQAERMRSRAADKRDRAEALKEKLTPESESVAGSGFDSEYSGRAAEIDRGTQIMKENREVFKELLKQRLE